MEKLNSILDKEIFSLLGTSYEEIEKSIFTRKQEEVINRSLIIWILNNPPYKMSKNGIGKLLRKNHATIIHNIKMVEKILELKHDPYNKKVTDFLNQYVLLLKKKDSYSFEYFLKNYSKYLNIKENNLHNISDILKLIFYNKKDVYEELKQEFNINDYIYFKYIFKVSQAKEIKKEVIELNKFNLYKIIKARLSGIYFIKSNDIKIIKYQDLLNIKTI